METIFHGTGPLYVRRIHRLPVNSPPKGQWSGALMFSFICAWTNAWVNNWDTGDLRRHLTHYVVTVMIQGQSPGHHAFQSFIYLFIFLFIFIFLLLSLSLLLLLLIIIDNNNIIIIIIIIISKIFKEHFVLYQRYSGGRLIHGYLGVYIYYISYIIYTQQSKAQPNQQPILCNNSITNPSPLQEYGFV